MAVVKVQYKYKLSACVHVCMSVCVSVEILFLLYPPEEVEDREAFASNTLISLQPSTNKE